MVLLNSMEVFAYFIPIPMRELIITSSMRLIYTMRIVNYTSLIKPLLLNQCNL